MLATLIKGKPENVKIKNMLQLRENNKSHSGKKKATNKKCVD